MRKHIIALSLIAAVSAPVMADGLPVEPGLWSITTTTQVPMLPSPQTMTVEECFEDEIMDMDQMADEDLDVDCTYEMGSLDGDTMAWTIDCPVEGGTMHAAWQATSQGDSVDGAGTIDMNMQGMTMQMTVSWEGKRIGDCK